MHFQTLLQKVVEKCKELLSVIEQQTEEMKVYCIMQSSSSNFFLQ